MHISPQNHKIRAASVLAAITNEGQTLDDLKQFMLGLKAQISYSQTLRLMVKEGQLFYYSIKVGEERACRRYFSNPWARDEFKKTVKERNRQAHIVRQRALRASVLREEVKKTGHKKNYSVIILTASQKPKPKPSHKYGAFAEGPADDSKAKWTIAPKPVDRYAAELPKVGGFSSLRPGQYQLEASTCAARAA